MTASEAILTAIHAAFGDRAAGVQLAPMPGGKSGAQLFAFAIDGTEYVVRQAGFGPPGDPTKSERELACIRIAAELGVAPRLVHGDASLGVSIMEKVAGTPVGRYTPRDDDPLGRVAATLRTLHGGPAFPASPSFAALLTGLDAELRTQGGAALPAELVDTVRTFGALVEESGARVPCHRDLNPTNILATPEHVYLVDWEVAGMSDPFLDLGQLGVWVCRDADERAHLLASYLERAPGPAEVTRAGRCRVLALGFYAAAFHLVSLFTGRTVVPTDEDNALEAVFARMARTGQPFAAEEMAAAMVAEMTREVHALG